MSKDHILCLKTSFRYPGKVAILFPFQPKLKLRLISAAGTMAVSSNAENNNYIVNSLKTMYGIESSENPKSLVRSRWMKLFHVQTFIGESLLKNIVIIVGHCF